MLLLLSCMLWLQGKADPAAAEMEFQRSGPCMNDKDGCVFEDEGVCSPQISLTVLI